MATAIKEWPVVGHEASVNFLQRLIQPAEQAGRSVEPRHAYLLLGPRQVGKRTVAESFAQALFCTTVGQQPCGHCRSCHLFLHGNHPDFRSIQPLDKAGKIDRLNGTLRVEQAAEIIHDVAMRPMESRYKIFLIQDLHTANDSFANKLLKTLEEPPAHAIFLVTALDRSRLLATIVSRCQLLELRPLAPQTIAQALMTRWQIAPTEADLLSRLARGRLGWAVQQIETKAEQQMRLAQLETLWKLLQAAPVERLSIAEKLATTGGQQLFELLEIWGTWWRDLLLVQSGCIDICCNIDQRTELERQANLIAPKMIQQYLRTLSHIEGYLHHTINTRLALEVLLLKMPAAGSS